jgi:hypothetical protein
MSRNFVKYKLDIMAMNNISEADEYFPLKRDF